VCGGLSQYLRLAASPLGDAMGLCYVRTSGSWHRANRENENSAIRKLSSEVKVEAKNLVEARFESHLSSQMA
jgi:hypothetical protein